MKRAKYLLVLCLALSLIFTACSNKSKKDDNTEIIETETETETETEEVEKPEPKKELSGATVSKEVRKLFSNKMSIQVKYVSPEASSVRYLSKLSEDDVVAYLRDSEGNEITASVFFDTAKWLQNGVLNLKDYSIKDVNQWMNEQYKEALAIADDFLSVSKKETFTLIKPEEAQEYLHLEVVPSEICYMAVHSTEVEDKVYNDRFFLYLNDQLEPIYYIGVKYHFSDKPESYFYVQLAENIETRMSIKNGILFPQ